jgi:AcrR family transcriptional regulator
MAAETAEKTGDAAPDERPLRQRILAAAFGAFMERGYGGTSTLEIATRAKVSKRELYALFRSKQAMLAACIESRARRMSFALELPEVRDRAALQAALIAYGATLLREVCRAEVLALYRLAVTEAERSPELARTLYASGREPNRAALADLLVRARAARLVRAGEIEAMAAQFFSLLWDDLLVRLMLRVAAPPDEPEILRRAHAAAAAVLALHPAPGGAGRLRPRPGARSRKGPGR